MTKSNHKKFIFSLILILILVSIYLVFKGRNFYQVSLEERFFHPDYKLLKPSGAYGHAYGILGSLFMLIGVVSYMLKKRLKMFSRFGSIKHWLEFHIFLCTLGPLLVLFHTSFKFGGIVAISFWSMVAVFLSGIVGRFIYIQIPRSIEGRELSLSEVKNLRTGLENNLNFKSQIDDKTYQEIIQLTRGAIGKYYNNIFTAYIQNYFADRRSLAQAKLLVQKKTASKREYKEIMKLLKNEISINRKIERLTTMKNLLKYWHVAHLPFAFIMLIVMIIHVVITMMFGSS